MSGRSGASGSVRSCGGSVRLMGPAASAGHEVVLDALYERKRDKKSVRVLTVIIYVFSVSLAAIMLSLYYVFFWEPKDAHYAQRKVFHTVEQQTSTTPMPTCFMPLTGGGDNTVNGTTTSEPANIAVGLTNSNATSDAGTTATRNTSVIQTTPNSTHNATSNYIDMFNETDSIT